MSTEEVMESQESLPNTTTAATSELAEDPVRLDVTMDRRAIYSLFFGDFPCDLRRLGSQRIKSSEQIPAFSVSIFADLKRENERKRERERGLRRIR
jgi:hypothetical protein